MFDSLRDQMNGEPGLDADSGLSNQPGGETSASAPPSQGKFLGMTALQRLILAVLILLSVCILGSMCLMITGAIRIP